MAERPMYSCSGTSGTSGRYLGRLSDLPGFTNRIVLLAGRRTSGDTEFLVQLRQFPQLLDRKHVHAIALSREQMKLLAEHVADPSRRDAVVVLDSCLLYTSDAADE